MLYVGSQVMFSLKGQILNLFSRNFNVFCETIVIKRRDPVKYLALKFVRGRIVAFNQNSTCFSRRKSQQILAWPLNSELPQGTMLKVGKLLTMHTITAYYVAVYHFVNV